MKNAFLMLLLIVSTAVLAQHQHHKGMPMPSKGSPGSTPKADTTRQMNNSVHGMNESRHNSEPTAPANRLGMNRDGSMKERSDGSGSMTNYGFTMGTSRSGMTHSLSRNLSMNRNGSGTSWHPDNTPMYAYMSQPSASKWSYMLHYAVYLRYTSQNANNAHKRGNGRQFGAPNWVMGMAQRRVGQRGLFQVRAMLSLDPLTVGNGGYPLLFQTGESYKDQPLIDKQHPHDLISEVSISYSHSFSKDIDLYGYVGYPGEPALGPPAFMHRISAFTIPDAPLSHHWQDATHILFGVATAGFRYKWVKLEASTFKGREPDENRYNLDKPNVDSYSYRVSINPSPSLALQVSQGFLKSPEKFEPEENVVRSTASILHSKGLGPNRYVTSALVWGQNRHHSTTENSYLAESSLQMYRMAFYGRYEHVTKSAAELNIRFYDIGSPYNGPPLLTINNLTLGMNYRIAQARHTDLVVGAQLTSSMPDHTLQSFYGKTPISGEIYLRLSPSLMTMRTMQHSGPNHMKGMHL